MSTGPTLILDVSNAVDWVGPPVGMIRVVQELAWAAVADRPEIQLAVFRPAVSTYRPVARDWADRVLSGSASVAFPIVRPTRGWRSRVPSGGEIMLRLERLRLSTTHPAVAMAVDCLERVAALVPHDEFCLLASDGKRFDYVPVDLALGDPLPLKSGDTIILTHYNQAPAVAGRLKAAHGVRYVAFCHDMIPARHPEFFMAEDAAGFCAYWRGMLRVADRVIAVSQYTLNELTEWAADQNIPMPPAEVVQLASIARPYSVRGRNILPCGLKASRYALMVGTIEPRKGHQLLIDIWRELLREGLPQRHSFCLVFVGRDGWKTDHLKPQIAQLSVGGSLVHLSDISDQMLHDLYDSAAFCLLPSLAEGFGLPLIEAFSHGKTIITSTGGALPEVAGDYAPCLDPNDVSAWRRMIANWIADPSLPRVFEERIRKSFRRPQWRTVAQNIWKVAERAARRAPAGAQPETGARP
jgi:glycosyltransferase involved in cell wall biosynthesis